MTNGSYQFESLESRNQEAIFLAERAQLRLDGFFDLLKRHQVPESGKMLEIGCGHGIRTHLLASYFPRAKVIGIDRSLELLSMANETYNNIENLSFQCADLYDLPFADNSIDFIYVRLVFMHLSQPMQALNQLRRILKPGGKIVIEDADRDCMFFEPAPASFKQFWQKVQEGQRRLGGDPNVGRKLAPYLRESGFKELKIDIQTIVGRGDEIAFLVRTLLPSLNVYLEKDDRTFGEEAIQDLQILSQDARASFLHFWFVVSAVK